MTVDAGNSIVDPRFRGRALLVELAAGVADLCREGGFLGFHHYPTTAHPILQRFAVASGGVETGIMLDYVPPGTEHLGLEAEPRRARTAVTVVYQPLALAPERVVHAPEPLAGIVAAIYARGRIARQLRASAGVLPPPASRLDTRLDRRRGCARIEVAEIGGDLHGLVHAAIADVEAALWQIDLPMADPAIGSAARAVADLGFFFCAVLPEYLDGDVLRLQRITTETIAPPDLASDDARELVRAIEADRAAVVAGRSAPRS